MITEKQKDKPTLITFKAASGLKEKDDIDISSF